MIRGMAGKSFVAIPAGTMGKVISRYTHNYNLYGETVFAIDKHYPTCICVSTLKGLGMINDGYNIVSSDDWQCNIDVSHSGDFGAIIGYVKGVYYHTWSAIVIKETKVLYNPDHEYILVDDSYFMPLKSLDRANDVLKKQGYFTMFDCDKINDMLEVYSLNELKIISKTKEVNEMNKIIAQVYEKTADAVLVQKWFGSQFAGENIVNELVLTANKDEVLKRAQALEAESQAKQQ